MAGKSTIQDVIDALQDALTAAEDIEDGGEEGEGGKAAALEAMTAIRQGRYTDAITTLEREFLPTWSDKAACEAAYRKART